MIFLFLRGVTEKKAVFWDVMPCNVIAASRHHNVTFQKQHILKSCPTNLQQCRSHYAHYAVLEPTYLLFYV